MANYFDPNVDLAFDAWLRRSTWDSIHPRDEAYFYSFLKALSAIDLNPNGDNLVKKIVQAVKDHHPALDESLVEGKAQEAVRKANVVFAYLRADQWVD